MMKGLTPQQLAEIQEFVQKHHRFCLYIPQEKRAERKKQFPLLPDSHGFGIKYFDVCYDSRDGLYWHICLRDGRYGVSFSANHFTGLNPAPKGWKYDNLYDLCMAYLKGEFIPKKEFQVDVYEENKRDRFEMIKRVGEFSGGPVTRMYYGVEFEEHVDLEPGVKPYWMCQGQKFEDLERLMVAIESGVLTRKTTANV